MKPNPVPYTVVRYKRNSSLLEQELLARFKTVHDATFFAKNVFRYTKKDGGLTSIKIYDSDSLKLINTYSTIN